MSSAAWTPKGSADPLPAVLALAWNHDASCLAVGTSTEFIVYTTDLMQGDDSQGGLLELVRRPVTGGVSILSIFDKSPVVVFAGFAGEKNSIVTIWDDSKADSCSAAVQGGTLRDSCVVAELQLSSPVRAIRCHPRVIIVAEAFKVWLFNSFLALIDVFPSDHSACSSNAIALASVAQSKIEFGGQCLSVRMLLPGPSMGELYCAEHFFDPPVVAGSASRRELVGEYRQQHLRSSIPSKPKNIWRELVKPKPHNHRVRAVAISPDGSRGLSVSENGTAIKLIDVEMAVVLRQFMRGVNPNEVRTLALNSTATLAACVSESGTLHLFNLAGQPSSHGAGSAAQSMQMAVSSWIGGLAPGLASSMKPVSNAVAAYKSERSFATFNLAPADDDVDYALLGVTDSSDIAAEDASLLSSSTVMTHETFEGNFSCVAFRSGFYNGESFLFVAQGCSGQVIGNRARCMRMSVQYPSSECKLLSTHLFPKDDL
jgi:WD40 repeat protein